MVLAAAGEVSHDTLLSIIVALFGLSISSPLVVMLIQSRRSRLDRAEDRAERRKVATNLLETTERTAASLGQIHVLVNSHLLEAQRRELRAVRQALQAMREAIAVKESAGLPVLAETRAAMSHLEHQIAALAGEMKARIDVEANGVCDSDEDV